jgi:uncharacterized protein YqhQ
MAYGVNVYTKIMTQFYSLSYTWGVTTVTRNGFLTLIFFLLICGVFFINFFGKSLRQAFQYHEKGKCMQHRTPDVITLLKLVEKKSTRTYGF